MTPCSSALGSSGSSHRAALPVLLVAVVCAKLETIALDTTAFAYCDFISYTTCTK
jgi:hypothetical protein